MLGGMRTWTSWKREGACWLCKMASLGLKAMALSKELSEKYNRMPKWVTASRFKCRDSVFGDSSNAHDWRKQVLITRAIYRTSLLSSHISKLLSNLEISNLLDDTSCFSGDAVARHRADFGRLKTIGSQIEDLRDWNTSNYNSPRTFRLVTKAQLTWIVLFSDKV